MPRLATCHHDGSSLTDDRYTTLAQRMRLRLVVISMRFVVYALAGAPGIGKIRVMSIAAIAQIMQVTKPAKQAATGSSIDSPDANRGAFSAATTAIQ